MRCVVRVVNDDDAGWIAAVAASARAQTAAPPPAAPITAGWQDGFILQSPNGDNRLVFGLTAQVDARFPARTIRRRTPAPSRSARPGQRSRAGSPSTSTSRSCRTSAAGPRCCRTPTSTCACPRSFVCAAGKTRRHRLRTAAGGCLFALSRTQPRFVARSKSRHRISGTGRSVDASFIRRRCVQRGARRHELHGGRRYQRVQGCGRTHRVAAISIDGDAGRRAQRAWVSSRRVGRKTTRHAAVVQNARRTDVFFLHHGRGCFRHARADHTGGVLLLQIVWRFRRVPAIGAGRVALGSDLAHRQSGMGSLRLVRPDRESRPPTVASGRATISIPRTAIGARSSWPRGIRNFTWIRKRLPPDSRQRPRTSERPRGR